MKFCASYFFLIVLILNHFSIFSQCPGASASNCDPVISTISLTNPSSTEFNFDTFSEISSGIVLSGSSLIKIKTFNNPALTCKWNLKMYVFNFGTIPITDWQTLANYGSVSSALTPPLNLIEVRLSNYCLTPTSNGIWQNFAASNGASIDIINNIGINLPGAAPACGLGQTNTAGSYLTNYGEYSFTIDYRIVPGYVYKPGRYTIKIVYCLSEM